MTYDNPWYDALGDRWWDPRGPVAALHEFNPVRARYFGETIRRELPDVERPLVLDVGCGGGLLAEAMAIEGFQTVGLDASLPSLDAARTHVATLDASLDGPPRYVGGDAQRLPFRDGSVDAVLCADIIEHLDEPDRLLRETARVLRPHGLLLFDTPNRTWFSRIGLIWLAENLGWAPKGTHEFSMFITPPELTARCAAAGLLVRELRGLSLARHPLAAAWGYLRRRELGGFELSDDTRLSYAGYATMPGDVAVARHAG